MNVKKYEAVVASRWLKLKGMRKRFVMVAGLGGETGEVLDILKKEVRDNKLDPDHLVEELSDALFYLTSIANHHGWSLTDVMQTGYDKVVNAPQRGH